MSTDLHCHTKISDGSASVEELIFIARRMGIKSLSITDHDTFAGAKRAIVLGRRYGLNIILGAEISSFSKNIQKELHILCYMCDKTDRLEGICLKNNKARKKLNTKIIEEISNHYPISLDTVLNKSRGSSNIFKNHIIQAIMDSGCVMPIYSIIYKKIFNDNSGFEVNTEYCEPEEVISQIHQAGGLAILAHPKESDLKDTIPYLIGLGIDGLEIYHPSISPKFAEDLLKITKKYGLLTTGGSDFHGMYSFASRCLNSFSTSESEIKKMISKKLKMKRGA